MDMLKTLLAAREETSPQVQELLQCLCDPTFTLQVCVCSVGGVGSTELVNFLTRAGVRCNLLTDQDAVRHVNRPPPQLTAQTRVIYLFGNPLACVASHYRRQHAYHQALKTSSTPTLSEADFPQTLQDYINRGEDLFGLEKHLDNWLHTPTAYDVLFVRYENMFDDDVAAVLFQHACGSASPAKLMNEPQVADMAARFAASKRQRSSFVTEEQQASMYTRLTAQVKALPPIFLRTGCACQIVTLLGKQSSG